MLNSTQVTIVGNVGNDPDMRFTPGGNAVTSLSVAVTPSKFNRVTSKWEPGNPTWYRVIAWRMLAENTAASIRRGMRVIVTGSLELREWERADGSKGYTLELTADAIGPDLTYATADVRRSARDSAPLPDDPWQGPASDTAPASGQPASDTAPASAAPAGDTAPASGKPASGKPASGKPANRRSAAARPAS